MTRDPDPADEFRVDLHMLGVDRERWTAPLNIPRGQGFDATVPNFYECSMNDPAYLEVWCYTDHITYEPGEDVAFHTSTSATLHSIEVIRDGARPVTMHRVDGLRGELRTTADDFFERGCGWPETHRWTLPPDLQSGLYIVITRAEGSDGAVREHEHGFIVRPRRDDRRAPILLVLATSTWTAYSNWGGTNNYMGLHPKTPSGFSPRLHVQRPWARGFMYVPEGAPRKPHDYDTRPGSIPRYPPIEFAYTRGYSKFYASAGYGTYEHPFVVWAETNGYQLDYATQIDLHYRPELLDAYPCVVMLGHDEYWSREMRQHIDRYVDGGGRFARFGGNFAWQIRLEDEGRVQVCYKEQARDLDPVAGTAEQHLLTSFWEDPMVHWPGAETVGVNALYGIYARVGHNAPRHSGGFTVYRPDHWALAGTSLCYGDQFGAEARIFGYELDGLDYEVRDGLPEPTGRDGALPGTVILAMGLCGNVEVDHGARGTVRFYGDLASEAMAHVRYGAVNPRTVDAAARGSGMVVSVSRGAGEIFCAGTCEWVNGLRLRDLHTEIITRNVLDRFAQATSGRAP